MRLGLAAAQWIGIWIFLDTSKVFIFRYDNVIVSGNSWGGPQARNPYFFEKELNKEEIKDTLCPLG